MEHPFISICIPAYKQISFLQRLLDSVSKQSFRDFEVIITDDSPDNQVETLITKYIDLFPVLYHKNSTPLGSPANWNQAIQLAKGAWIKIMHDDDWFASSDSLAKFAKVAQYSASSFIFSGFDNCDLVTGKKSRFVISFLGEVLMQRNPLCLFRRNLIGHPSTTLIRNNRHSWFDEKIKWVVDLEFYIRFLEEDGNFLPIKESLICIGIGDEQITNSAFRNHDIEIPENVYFLNLLGRKALKNIFVFDYYWRLLRNLRINNTQQINPYLKDIDATLRNPIFSMIRLQRFFGQECMAKIGVYSKSIMFFSFLSQYFKKTKS